MEAGPIPRLPQPEASGRLTGTEARNLEQTSRDGVLSSIRSQNAEQPSSIPLSAASHHPDGDANDGSLPENGFPGARFGNGVGMREQDSVGVVARSSSSAEHSREPAEASVSGRAQVDSEEAHTGPSTGRDSVQVAAGAGGKGRSTDGTAGPRMSSFTKTYTGEYILAQLLFWHRNVPGFDPVAALGESLRGTCLLPDPESVTRPAVPRERATWQRKLAAEPGAAWPSQWRFKDDALQVRNSADASRVSECAGWSSPGVRESGS